MAEMMNNDVQTLDCFVNISFIHERLRRLKDLLRQRCEGVVVHVWEQLQLQEDGARRHGQDDHLYDNQEQECITSLG